MRLIIQGDDLTAATTRETLALPDPYEHEAPRKITDEEREFSAYKTLREQRGFARNEGKRKLRAAKVRPFYFFDVEVADWEPNDRKRKRRPTRRSKGPPIPFLTVVVLLLYTLPPYTSLRRIAPVLLSHFCVLTADRATKTHAWAYPASLYMNYYVMQNMLYMNMPHYNLRQPHKGLKAV